MHNLQAFLPSFLVRRNPVPPTAAEIRLRSRQRDEMFRRY